MTIEQFNQSVILEIRRRMREAQTDKEEWPSIESQEAYWRERDENLDRTEATTQWYDEQGKNYDN